MRLDKDIGCFVNRWKRTGFVVRKTVKDDFIILHGLPGGYWKLEVFEGEIGSEMELPGVCLHAVHNDSSDMNFDLGACWMIADGWTMACILSRELEI